MTGAERTRSGARPAAAAIVLLLALTAPAAAGVADLESFAGRYRAASPAERPALARGFVERRREHGGFPIVDASGRAVFVYVGSGDEGDVRLVGDFRTRGFYDVYWHPEGVPMERLAPGGAVWVKELRFEPDARLDYQLLVDGERRVDPLNPRRWDNGIVGEVSKLAMPEYRPPAEVVAREGVPEGSSRVVDEPWAAPRVTVYLPPGYDAARTYPTLYTADGSAWIEYCRLPTILDNLIADGEIEPVIAVMVDPKPDRTSWYSYNPDFLAYLERVVAYVEGRYAARRGPEHRVHAGTSRGGAVTLYTGLERPDLFRKLALLSPSLFGPPSYWEPYFAGRRRPPPELDLWMSAGLYENYIYEDARTMAAWLRRNGLDPEVTYPSAAHSFANWRKMAPRMLRHFFGR